MEEPPEPGPQRAAREQGPARPRLGVDFVQRDARNRELDRNGEEWALELERRRLHDVDKRPDLSKRVEWVAGGDGSARVIEVKTTGLGKHFPFYVSANELRVSPRPRACIR